MKQGKTIDEQLQKLQKRKLRIEDYEEAAKILKNINYYTLTGYLFPFKYKENGNTFYKEEASFELAVNLYQFDNDIRSLLLSFVAEAEEILKTRIAYQIAIHHPEDPLIYTDINFWKNHSDYHRFIADFTKTINNNKDVLFVKHHIKNYRGQFPIWVAVNLFTLGNLKYLYLNIPSRDRKNISQDLNLSPKILDSWIDTLRILRNQLAHNMRLYGATYIRTPKWETHHIKRAETNKIFINFILLKYILKDSSLWKTNISRLEEILARYQSYIHLDDIGFPKNWQNILEI